MRWEELTGDEFAKAVEECQGVCLVSLSVVERHRHHLPLGTDTYQLLAVTARSGPCAAIGPGVHAGLLRPG
jgi:creatinine amidohydrolase